MSNTSNTEFMRVQRRLFNIYDNCNLMTNERLEETLDELSVMVRQMVRTRQLETTRPPALPRTVTPERPRNPLGVTPALQQPPRPPALPRTVTPERPRSPLGAPSALQQPPRPPAELRPAARAPVVPSVLMQEARSTLAPYPIWASAWPEWWERHTGLNKVRAIGRVKFNADCKEVCGICLDTHKKCDSVTTECGHEYCKQCWYSWMSNATSNRKCPTCRKNHPKTTTFKLMADRKSRQSVPVQQPMQIF